MNKIKLAFDPTNIWNNVFFSEFIKTLIADTDNYDVYLITTNTDVANVVLESNIDSANVVQLPNNTAIGARLTSLKVNIYLTEDNVLCNYINSVITIQLNSNNVVGCQSLVLNNIMDLYLSQPKYITLFDFWCKQILKQY